MGEEGYDAKGDVHDGRDMPKVEGCVWVLSTIYNFLTYGNKFLCHACKCLRVCTRCIGALSTHYFRYGEKHGKTTKKKRSAFDIPSAFSAFSHI